MRTYRTGSPSETVACGRAFASELRPGDVVALIGNLGSGKTQFVLGVCEGLHVRGHVASPTFTLINEYEARFGKVVHIDLYRIGKRAEIAELGIEEYFNEQCLCLIEWPELIADILPRGTREVRIAYGPNDNDRVVSISGVAAA